MHVTENTILAGDKTIENEKLRELFHATSVNKEMTINIGDSIILHNEDIYMESFRLEESLCEEENLKFGLSNSTRIEVQIYNVADVTKGQTISVFLTLEGAEDEQLQLFEGVVDSAEMSGDKKYKKITAYDEMYEKEKTEMSEWYNSLEFPLTLKQFRDSFFEYLGIIQEDTMLINDNMLVEQTIQPSQLDAATVANAICEINGCFGHMGRTGKFRYIFLPGNPRVLYPDCELYPSENIYPAGDDEESGEEGEINEEVPLGTYIECTYEDYETCEIDKLQIRQEENDIGVVVGEGSNCYVIEDNFLVYGKMSARFAEQALQEALATKEAAVEEAEKEYASTVTSAEERLKDANEIKADYNEKIAEAKAEMQEVVDAAEPEYVAAVKKIEEDYAAACEETEKIYTATVANLQDEKALKEQEATDKCNNMIQEAADQLENGEISQSKYESVVEKAQNTKANELAEIEEVYANKLSIQKGIYNATKTQCKREYQTQLGNAKKAKEKALEDAGTKCAEKFLEAQTMLSGTLTQEEYEKILEDAETTRTNALQDAEAAYQSQCDNIAAKSNGDEIGENIYNIIQNVSVYRPFEAETAGNPLVEVGDSIQVNTNNETVISYVLKRNLTGIQALKDTYSATGDEKYPETTNAVSNEIVQLKGKLNTLIRTVEETTAEIQDIEKGLASVIRQTAESITMEVMRSVKSEDGITEYASKIEQMAESIALTVAQAKEGGETWESTLKLVADNIQSKVAKGDIVSSINQSAESVTIDASKINLNGAVTANGNFKIGTDGKIEATGAKLSGDIEAKTLTCYEYLKMKLNDTYPAIPVMKINIWPKEEGQSYAGEVTFASMEDGLAGVNFKTPAYFSETVYFKEISATRGDFSKSVYVEYNVEAESVYVYKACAPYYDYEETDSGGNLGISERRWRNIYSRTTEINTSDKNSKREINAISEKYEDLWKLIKPVTFMFNDGDRVHVGIIAQELEEAMKVAGLEAEDVAMFCKDVKRKRIGDTEEFEDVIDENGEKVYQYGVRYGELISLNTHMLQKLYQEKEQQDEKIEKMEEKVEKLEEIVEKQNTMLQEILSKLQGE